MCQQFTSSAKHKGDSDTFGATVLAGQAEMAFPAWVGLHSENYSFSTVL